MPFDTSLLLIYFICCCCCSVTKLCPILCYFICSLPGSSVHGISQARILEWIAISYSIGDLPDTGMKPMSPALVGGFFTTESSQKPILCIVMCICQSLGFPGGSDGKESACNTGDLGSMPGLGRSPGKGDNSPLHYSCLENSMDRGAWQPIAHGVAKSWTQLNDSHFRMSNPISQFIHPPFSPPVTITLFSTSMTVFLFYKQVQSNKGSWKQNVYCILPLPCSSFLFS